VFTYGQLLFQEAMAQEAESRAHGVDSLDATTRQQGLDFLYAAHALYLEAIKHLDEAVQRYPDAESTHSAWYAIAESYRHAAKLPSKSMLVEPAQAGRNVLHEQKRTYLEAAAEAYRQLQARLLQMQEQTELPVVEQALLRNTYFAYADVLFDLDDYEQAIKAYLAATNRYQQEPAALEAFVQLASCYRLLNAPAEARGTLLQAQAVLSRMRPDADFTRTTRYNRDEWNQIIGWLAQL
jgi:tetratricopeptide (TPR) repeat protein